MFSLSSSIRYSCGVSGGVPQPGTHDCGEMPVSRLVFFFFFFMPISFFFHISMVPLWRPGQTGFLFWLAFRDPLYASRHNGGLIEPNRITFDWKSNGKLSPRSYPIQCERKWKYSFPSAGVELRYLASESCRRFLRKSFAQIWRWPKKKWLSKFDEEAHLHAEKSFPFLVNVNQI